MPMTGFAPGSDEGKQFAHQRVTQPSATWVELKIWRKLTC